MDRIIVQSKIDGDGVLQIVLPVGKANADQDVQIIVEPIVHPQLTGDLWRQGILETAGKWQGEFERPEQGDYERREPLA